jgi:hypothetical protein
VAHGDWQTPQALADAVVALVSRDAEAYRAVLEPTCGVGNFLAAAARALPEASLVGFDRSPEYAAAARATLPAARARLEVADFFEHDWGRTIAALPEPFLLLGNPPWVTSATLGALSVANAPVKSNAARQSGVDALTGKSNFDISEWMLMRLLEAARGRHFTLAMLCKAAVARRVLVRCASEHPELGGSVYAVDARAHFAAAVSAVLLVLRPGAEARGETARFAVHSSLEALEPARYFGVSSGRSCADLDAYRATSSLEGTSALTWRSGVKHDLARVMELTERGGELKNGLGEVVRVEPEYLYPLCKSSSLAHGSVHERRFVIVTQKKLGDDTLALRELAPDTWRYLERHRASFEARKSRIYRRQAPFAMFGVGPYTFAPYKVAISGLYKQLTFRVLAPVDGRPIVLDDTTYFLPCETRERAEALATALASPLARRFFEARIFWDDMRPVTKALLASLSLERLLAELALA